jgi:hypothetical protein
MQINKSDRNDAVGIARIMQCGWYKEVHVKDLDGHATKALLVSRALLDGATHSHLLSVQPPATLFLHAALDLYLLAQRNKNRSLYVASHCNQPAAKSSVEIYG